MAVGDPLLSVVLMVGEQRDRGARCLASILAQSLIARVEVLLLDASRQEHGALTGADHPSVRVTDLPRGIGFGQARASAVSLARAPVIAFLEEHVTVYPGWAEAVWEAHQGEWVGVGPEVHSGNPGRGDSDVVELLGYGPWTAPARRGATRALRGQNASYRRDVLLSYGQRLPLLLSSDYLLNKQLVRDGYHLLTEPKVKIAHANESYFSSFCRGLYTSVALYSAAQAQVFCWSRARRAAYLVACLGLPASNLAYILLSLCRHHRDWLPRAVESLPLLLLAQVLSAVAFGVGLVQGRGGRDVGFLEYELNQYRGIEGIKEVGGP